MRRKFNKKFFPLLALLMAGLGLQACVIDTQCEYREYKDVCSTDCFGFDCVTTCETLEYCIERSDIGSGCRSHNDCLGKNSYCNAQGACETRKGQTAMCGQCNDSGDCFDYGAACVTLNSGESVCMKSCRGGCPSGFTCVAFSGIEQCLPDNQSCDPSYCQFNTDCPSGTICANNRCQYVEPNNRECNTHQDCSRYHDNKNICVVESKDVSYCTTGCYRHWDCPNGMICYMANQSLDSGACIFANGNQCQNDSDCPSRFVCASNNSCYKSCERHSQCASQSGNFACINGLCQ